MNKHTKKTSAIVVAGGIGSRMGSTSQPKQFLTLNEKPIACYSFDLFLSIDEIDEIIVVCDPQFQHLFSHTVKKTVHFAPPGKRRQDSVYNGFQVTNPSSEYICIHDGARPFIDRALVLRVLEAGDKHGAATAAMKVRFTVKESGDNDFVAATPDRKCIWEIQTPQVIRRDILTEGFRKAFDGNLTVTDDVSLAELINHPVKLIEGSCDNIKITIPQDLMIAKHLMNAYAT